MAKNAGVRTMRKRKASGIVNKRKMKPKIVSYTENCEHTRTLLSGTTFASLFQAPFADVLDAAKNKVPSSLRSLVQGVIDALLQDGAHLTLSDLFTTEPATWPRVKAASELAAAKFIVPYVESDVNRWYVAAFLANSTFLIDLGKEKVKAFYEKKMKKLTLEQHRTLREAKRLHILRLSPRPTASQASNFTIKGRCATYGAGGWTCKVASDTDECSLDANTGEPLAGSDIC